MSVKDEITKKYREVHIESCPFCGNEKLYFGVNDSTSSCVQCECGAKVVDRMPNDYSKADLSELKRIEKHLGLDFLMSMIAFHTLKAVEKWNRRV